VGEDFVTRTGVVNRTGIVDGSAFNRISFYGAPGGVFEKIDIITRPYRLWATEAVGAGDAIEGGESLSTGLQLRGGWRAEANVNRSFWRLDPDDYANYSVFGGDFTHAYSPAEKLSGVRYGIDVTTPAFRAFDARLGLSRGATAIFAEGSEGTETAVSGNVGLRMGESVRLGLSGNYRHIARVRDDSRFGRSLITRARLELQPTRAFFMRAIAELRNESQDALRAADNGNLILVDGVATAPRKTNTARIDLLASYEPVPGTVAYLGYGASLGTDEVFEFRRLERESDGLFLKVAYRFRW